MLRTISLAAGITALAAMATAAQAAPAVIFIKGPQVQKTSNATKVAYRPPVIRQILRDRGYYRIRFTDRQLPVYQANACKNGKRFHLRINRWGDIIRRKRIGWCDRVVRPGPGLSLPAIRQSLRDRGYRRIVFTDRQLPVYQANACRNGKRFHLRLNRWGRILDRYRIGWCGPRRPIVIGPLPYLYYYGNGRPGLSIYLNF